MQKVKMLKEVLGSRDGIKVEKFVEGSEHEISDGLLNDFISMGAVELVEAKEVKEEPVKPVRGRR
jgi:hypothetical protein